MPLLCTVSTTMTTLSFQVDNNCLSCLRMQPLAQFPYLQWLSLVLNRITDLHGLIGPALECVNLNGSLIRHFLESSSLFLLCCLFYKSKSRFLWVSLFEMSLLRKKKKKNHLKCHATVHATKEFLNIWKGLHCKWLSLSLFWHHPHSLIFSLCSICKQHCSTFIFMFLNFCHRELY